jgi:hypothetical protein
MFLFVFCVCYLCFLNVMRVCSDDECDFVFVCKKNSAILSPFLISNAYNNFINVFNKFEYVFYMFEHTTNIY